MEPETNVYTALAKAQAEMTAAAKGSLNKHLGNKYADLAAVQDACLPALNKQGFAVYQPFVADEAGYWVETILAHYSGASLSCRIPLILGKHDMQGLGSAITYARRYGLLCMSGVAPEDDDGNKAADQGHKEPVRHKAPQKPASDPAFEIDVERACENIAAAGSISELMSVWNALNTTKKAVVADNRVIKAKDDRKAQLTKEEEQAA